MEDSNLSKILTDILFGNGDMQYLASALCDEDKNDNSLRESNIKACEEFYGKKLWRHFCEITKEHIISANATIQIALVTKTDLSSSIFTLARSLEDELKDKIFNDFNIMVKEKIDSYKNIDVHNEYIKGIEKNYVAATLMLSKLRYISIMNPIGIAKDLREYLENDWDVYSLSNRARIEEAMAIAKYRTNNGHDNINFNFQDYTSVKEKTKRTLSWFISSSNYY